MSLYHLYSVYQRDGLAGIRTALSGRTRNGIECFYAALAAFAAGEFDLAAEYARDAAHLDPEHSVYAQAAVYLDRVQAVGKQQVYVDGEAFAAFIRGGSNIALYQSLSRELKSVYEEYDALRLIDIGVGDGMALAPALAESVCSLDIVEPSAAMLARTTAELGRLGIANFAFCGTVQEFIARQAGEGRWDLAQATFSLHSIPRIERRGVLRWLRGVCDRLLIAEFDVAASCDISLHPDCVTDLLNRYKSGLAEYQDDGGMVAQGFLLPVMFGYFDPTVARTTYEQPISAWKDGLREAGFTSIDADLIYKYWWADAYLIDAQ